MAIGCGAKCAKFLLFGFNIVFWLTGVGLIVLGAIYAANPDLLHSVNFLADAADLLKASCYVMIGIGCVVFIIGFCGCCGAIKESQCLLGTYIFFLVVIIAAEIAVGIIVALKKKEILGKSMEESQKRIKKDYPKESGDWNSFINNKYRISTDYMQIKSKCCGAQGFADYEGSEWMKGFTAIEKVNYNIKVPAACCGYKDSKATSADVKKCVDDGAYYKTGCQAAVLDQITAKLPIVIGVACGIAALEIFGVIFAICLCCNVGREERYH